MDTNSHEYRFIGSDLNPPSTIAGWSQPSTPRKLEWAKKNVAANERMSAYLRVYGHQHEPAEDLGSHVITDEDSPEPPWKSCKEGKAPISGADKVSAKMTKWGKKGLSKVSSKAS